MKTHDKHLGVVRFILAVSSSRTSLEPRALTPLVHEGFRRGFSRNLDILAVAINAISIHGKLFA